MNAIIMLAAFAVIAIIFIAAERLAPWRAQKFFRRGLIGDAGYVVIHFLMRVVINGTVAVAMVEVSRRVLPSALVAPLDGRPVWLQAIVVLLVLDLIFYVTHRLKHRWTWWWRLHETHHSSDELDWLSGSRFHPIEKLIDRSIYLLPLTILSPSPGAVLIWASTDAFFGMFVHANVKWTLGPLRYIFVGPEMHRWHHVTDRSKRECNYGNNFSIFDWLFGTAYVGTESPATFGVEDPNYPLANPIKQFFYAFRRSGR